MAVGEEMERTADRKRATGETAFLGMVCGGGLGARGEGWG